MTKKKKIDWIGIAVLVLISIIVGGCLGWFVVYSAGKYLSDMSLGKRALMLALMFGWFYVALLLQVVLHEAGHLLFGLLSGYKFHSFRIFNFMWIKLDGKIRLKRFSLAGTAGQCLMEPPALKEGKMPVVAYNLGGVAVNFIIGGLCIALALVCKDSPVLFVGYMILAIVGVLEGIVNGVPLRVSSISTDGANALALVKDKKAIYSLWLQMRINCELAKGTRGKDLPEEWFVMPTDEELKNGMLAAQAVMRLNYLLDCHEFVQAKELIEKLLNADAATIGVHENLMECELVYIALVIDDDKNRAEELWTKELAAFMKSMKKFPTVIRVRYAYALLKEGEEEKAAEHLKLFEEVAKKYPYEADIQLERELLEMAKEKYSAAEQIVAE